MLTSRVCRYLNECYLTKNICIFLTKKDSEMPVLDMDFALWQCLDPFAVTCLQLFLTYVIRI